MDKKKLRKEMELALVKTIEDVLNKQNAEASKKIRETTLDASKKIAKKFYKTFKADAPKPKLPSKPSIGAKLSKPAAKSKTPVKTKKIIGKK